MEQTHPKSWAAEDAAFAPKRRVQNRGSQKRPHVIGAFYSAKMDRVIEYESLNEYLFFGLLEMHPQVMRYYVQPIAIPVVGSVDGTGAATTWPHVVDVLVFQEGTRPCLYDIKAPDASAEASVARVRPSCERYAAVRGWGYTVVYPRQLPRMLAMNVKRLLAFTRPRPATAQCVPKILARMEAVGTSTVAELATTVPEMSPGHVLPVVYHLIALGRLVVDLQKPIDSATVVQLRRNDESTEPLMPWR